MSRTYPIGGLLVALLLVACVALTWPVSDPAPAAQPVHMTPTELVSRGQYIATAANCVGCHTVRGGAPYAGGRVLRTQFGNFYAPNITPDAQTGLGGWTAEEFWQALHLGRARDGQLLYPAFPYPSYTKISRADSDALFAYLQSLPAVKQANLPHQLQFPYSLRPLLRVWQRLYFTPGSYVPDPAKPASWNRGAYLVEGPGHCAACHTGRNELGAADTRAGLAGANLIGLGWYAPPLGGGMDTGLGAMSQHDVATLLKSGVSSRSAVFGPMAEVVQGSLQHLRDDDIDAMAAYLKSLPVQDAPTEESLAVQADERLALRALGKRLYDHNCASCHRGDGNGIPGVYPPLNGNPLVTGGSPINMIRIVLHGGFPPATQLNPRPYGMPPFEPTFSDKEVAAVVSYTRNTWRNHASYVSPNEVDAYRAVPEP